MEVLVVQVIIAGCGRVGAQLAHAMSAEGHEVAVIDKNPAAFRRLGRDFSGRTVAGIVFDRAILEQAGIRQAQAFVAVTSGDNSNIVSARVAREYYGVDRVVARIYDPERASIYERLGVHTIASARWTAEAVLRALLPDSDRIDASVDLGGGDVVVLTYTVPLAGEGLRASDVDELGNVVLVAVTSGGSTRLPTPQTVLAAGDQLHLAVTRAAIDSVRGRITALAHGQSGAATSGDEPPSRTGRSS